MNENKIICSECNKIFNTKLGLLNHNRNGCVTLKSVNLKKECPICKSVIKYQCKYLYDKSILNNSKCRKCSNLGRHLSENTKSKISNKLLKKYKSGKIKANMSGTQTSNARLKMAATKRGKPLSENHKQSISNSLRKSEKMKNHINSDRFKSHLTEIQKKRVGCRHSIETKNKMSINHSNVSGENNPFYKKKHCKKTKQKMRMSALNRIKNCHGEFVPSFNKNGCEYFDKLMMENKCSIQHALNGGEYYIKELGYWLDGYDKENNIAYEWDEKRHFNVDGTLKQKDIDRQREIEEFLKCKFIRIKEEST